MCHSRGLKFAATKRSDIEQDTLGSIVTATRALRAHDPARTQAALHALQNAARANGNTFAELLQAVKVCSLGQITHALYDVGGRYRRNM